MNQVAALVFVPPAEKLDLHAGAFERELRLLDLRVGAPVRQQEGQVLVNQDFHASNMPFGGLLAMPFLISSRGRPMKCPANTTKPGADQRVIYFRLLFNLTSL